ncbi:MAG TPA: rRNA maturation RNase YbeY [Candidatus Edwardsbacteria bacterium]|nr:rRNA maturation RNase YbeY [Candidatus Edwardsbacteria bacterium]
MRIHIEHIDRSHQVDEPAVRRLIATILKREGCCQYDLTLVFTDSGHIRRLNRRFRNIDRVTDVISFAMMEGAGAGFAHQTNLGDIYVSLQRTWRQARDYRTSFEDELHRLVAHGLLHLLGYDHIKPRQACLMRRKEERYLYGQ